MKKILLLFVLVLTAISFNAVAKSNSSSSYNMQRGLEEVEKGDFQSALGFFNKEIDDNPKNGEAYMSVALASLTLEDLEEGMQAINRAIKYLPAKDKEKRAASYTIRGEIYLLLEDSIKAEEDFTFAIKTNPDYQEAYNSRGNLYHELKRYDESDADFQRLKKINAANPLAYIGLGRNQHSRGNYEEAIAYFNKAIKIDANESDAYAARAETRFAQKKYAKAADDIIMAFGIDYNRKAFDLMQDFPEDQYNMLIAKINGRFLKEPHEALWPYCVGELYQDIHNYEESEKAFKKTLEIDDNPFFYRALGDLYLDAGDYEKAIENFLWAKDIDFFGTYSESCDANIAVAIEFLGDLEGALKQWDKIIENVPDDFFAYYKKGFINYLLKNYDEAKEALDMSASFDPSESYVYITLGDLLRTKGDEESALDWYRKAVEKDTVAEKSSYAMIAYSEIGEKEKAKELMTGILEKDPKDCVNFYEAACFYARMGELEKSLEYLKKSFDLGFNLYYLLALDYNLANLRDNDEFKKIYDEYKDLIEEKKTVDLSKYGLDAEEEEEISADFSELSSRKVEIPFTPDAGCVLVKCSINELPLSFVFDTGASVVSISQLEASFMLKNGFLSKEDIVGTDRYIDANGDVSEGTVINLKNVEFGGVKLNNVKASVVRNQKAPLLLGQSVMNRLGKIEIDNQNKKLVITTK